MKPADCSVVLLEYDQRFQIYGKNFVPYDYRQPLNLPAELVKHSFDLVIADPPFLSEECLQKTAQTINYLTQGRILLCTGILTVEGSYFNARNDLSPIHLSNHILYMYVLVLTLELLSGVTYLELL